MATCKQCGSTMIKGILSGDAANTFELCWYEVCGYWVFEEHDQIEDMWCEDCGSHDIEK